MTSIIDVELGGIYDRDVRFAGALDRLLYLRSLAFMSSMDASDLKLLAQHTTERFFPQGEKLLSEGEPVDSVHFLVEGRVAMRSGGVTYQTLDAPGSAGFLAMLTGDPKGVDAVAELDTLSLAVPSASMLYILEDNFNFLRGAIRGLSGQIADIQQRLESRGLLTRSEPEETPYLEHPLDMVQRLHMLRRGPYATVSLEPLMELVRLSEELRLEPGDVLWRQGEPSGWGIHLAHGVVRCKSADGSRDFVMGPDSVVGYLEANADRPRAYEATAETRVVALKCTMENYFDVLEDHVELGIGFASFMAEIVTDLQIKAHQGDVVPDVLRVSHQP